MLTPHEKRQLIALLEKLPTTKPCTECKNFDHLGSCKLAPNEMIPQEVIKVGCPAWEFNELSPPF